VGLGLVEQRCLGFGAEFGVGHAIGAFDDLAPGTATSRTPGLVMMRLTTR